MPILRRELVLQPLVDAVSFLSPMRWLACARNERLHVSGGDRFVLFHQPTDVYMYLLRQLLLRHLLPILVFFLALTFCERFLLYRFL